MTPDQAAPLRWNRVALYARISKSDAQTNEQQIAALLPWLKPQAEYVFVCPEEESSHNERPRLDALRKRMLAAEFDAIVVWKLDRLARNSEELLRWRSESRAVGFTIVSFTQAIDLSTSGGRLMYGILALFAENERDNIAERTKFKLDYLRKQGIVPGVGKGSKKGAIVKRKPGEGVYDEEKAKKLWNSLTDRELAKALGVSKSTARRVKVRMERESGPRLRPMALTAEQKRIEELEERVKELETLLDISENGPINS